MNKNKKPEKFEKMISVASELFADKDFHNVCMDDIAAKAHVGKGTLYNYFSSKEDLYFSIIHFRLNNLIEILEKAYDQRNDTLKNLRSLILHLHKFMSKHPHFYFIWKKEEYKIGKNNNKTLMELRNKMINLVDKILIQGQEEQVIRQEIEKELITNLILGMIDGLEKSQKNVYKKEKAIDTLLFILLKGIGNEKIDLKVTYEKFKHKTVKRNEK